MLASFARHLRAAADWLLYFAVALACTAYLNHRAKLVPKWGEWYMASEGDPYTLLQVRSMLSGRLALIRHPWGLGNDYVWGRGGMHTAWGLGVPLLAAPFHLLGRMFGAPGFPDNVRFLILYAITTVLLARALHRASRNEANSLVASATAAGFVMVFPTFVGHASARFLIYDITILTGALWDIVLLAGVVALVDRCTAGRLVLICAAAGFSTMIRPTLAAYGATTLVLALIIAQRKRMRPPVLVAGFLAFAAVTGLYLAGNSLRFGSPWNAGPANIIGGTIVNRLSRWGLSFAKVSFTVAAKEMFATMFLLEPVSSQIMMGAPPPSVQPYVVGERWREYYSPTYDLVIFGAWLAALGIVGFQIIRRRLWRSDRDLRNEIAVVVGAWGLPTSIALFVFYARVGNIVTRYTTDVYPALAATSLCVGMAIVNGVRARAPAKVPSAQLVLAGVVALYLGGWRGWARHLSTPVDRQAIVARIAAIDSMATAPLLSVPDHFKCSEPRGLPPVHSHLQEWRSDCFFSSGMVFALPHSPCVSFTFAPGGAAWGPSEEESLAGFRANADFDELVRCGAPAVEGSSRRLTMCDPHTPPFLLDGMRLYAIASLDDQLGPIDRLKLLEIDGAPPCGVGRPR
jgi:hypothetical protein